MLRKNLRFEHELCLGNAPWAPVCVAMEGAFCMVAVSLLAVLIRSHAGAVGLRLQRWKPPQRKRRTGDIDEIARY